MSIALRVVSNRLSVRSISIRSFASVRSLLNPSLKFSSKRSYHVLTTSFQSRDLFKHQNALSSRVSQPIRHLNLHEYQSKSLMAKYNVRVQKGHVAFSPEEAVEVAEKLKKEGATDLVIKAQIHAGGRGKGHFNTGFKGGVKVCTSPEKIGEYAKEFIGNNLITAQTGPDGQPVKCVLVHEGISFDRELYFAILLDRAHNGPVMVASPSGGMDIEQVAHSTPELIYTRPIDIIKGITDNDVKYIAEKLEFNGVAFDDACQQMKNLYNLFINEEATQVEINPLVQTKGEGLVYCVDAKILFDDNAAYRHQKLHAQRDTSMEDQREVEASKVGLNYIGLDGNIGCLVNGAGLAMATMDAIKLKGGSPANFLDVGGSATETMVESAFRILTHDPKVKAILVNIFGGIMKCDIIANGVVAAAKNLGLKVPLVVRLEGTNVEKGNEILQKSGLKIVTANDLDDAATKAVSVL